MSAEHRAGERIPIVRPNVRGGPSVLVSAPPEWLEKGELREVLPLVPPGRLVRSARCSRDLVGAVLLADGNWLEVGRITDSRQALCARSAGPFSA
jgi:hypothetical protein